MKENLNDSDQLIQLIIKELTNEANQEEKDALKELLKEPENEKLYNTYKHTLNRAELIQGITKEDEDQEWLRLENAISGKRIRKPTPWIRIAALLAVMIGTVLAVYQYSDQTETIVVESLIEKVMEDGSSITLKSGSTLSYDGDYNSQDRRVELKGEAFFDVVKNEKPFIVKIGEMDVTVLGTSFNVKASTDRVEVVLVDGKVAMNGNGNALALAPGEKGIFDIGSGQIFKIVNDDPNFQSWNTRVFTFNSTPLQEAIELLNGAYDLKISLKDISSGQCPITADFEQLPLSDVVEILTSILNLESVPVEEGFVLEGKGCD